MSKPTRATVTFSIGANQATMPAPTPGYTTLETKAQAIGQTAAGVDFVYDKAYTIYEASLTFVCTETQKDAFIAWFNTHPDGMVNTFDYRDHFNTVHHLCRFLDPALNFSKTAGGYWTVTIRMRVTATLD